MSWDVAMKQTMKMVVFGASLVFGAQAWSQPVRHVSAHRLLNKCMSREMTLSRKLSYYEASALCKARLVSARPAGAPAVAAVFPPRSVRSGGGS
jgi:hypothetical protein